MNPATTALLSPLSHFRPNAFLCVVSAFQRSAMKPYTCAIMTWESLGDGSTSAMWNSAPARPGRPSVNAFPTQVRPAGSCCSALNTLSAANSANSSKPHAVCIFEYLTPCKKRTVNADKRSLRKRRPKVFFFFVLIKPHTLQVSDLLPARRHASPPPPL